jgi:hypothetical protein
MSGVLSGSKMEVPYIEILIKFLNIYLESYAWRMDHYYEIQKFVFKLTDIILGTTEDCRYIRGIRCPKLYSLVNRDSVLFQDIEFHLKPNRITATIEMNTFDEKVGMSVSDEVEWTLPPVQLSETEKPENVDVVYADNKWKSEAWVVVPLIIEFFTSPSGERVEVLNNRVLFEINLRDLVHAHVCPSKEKIEELIKYYFDGRVLYNYLPLFVEVIYMIISPEGTEVKEDFDKDVRKIIEVLTRYVQAE